MRSDKFKFIMDAMASHAIHETNSEYSASFLSEGGRQGNRGNQNPHQKHGNAHSNIANTNSNYDPRNNSTVLEVDELSEKSSKDQYQNRTWNERQKKFEEDSYYDPDEMHNQDNHHHNHQNQDDQDMQSEESFQQPVIVRKKK